MSEHQQRHTLETFPWGKAIFLGIALAVLGLLAVESGLRSWGRKPGFRESQFSWAQRRASIETPGDDTLVVIGASRIQAAFWPHELARYAPDQKVAMLPVYGVSNCIPTLEDLLSIPDFRGTVLVSVHEWTTEKGATQQPWVDAYHTGTGASSAIDLWLRQELHSRVVVFGDFYNPVSVSFRVVKGIGDSRPLVLHHRDGSIRLDFETKMAKLLIEFTHAFNNIWKDNKDNWGLDSKSWVATLYGVNDKIKAFAERGGKVIFLRMPISGDIHFKEEDWKKSHWDPLCAKTAAECIHFGDVPELKAIPTPDGGHIDYRDSARATKVLYEELKRRGLLKGDS